MAFEAHTHGLWRPVAQASCAQNESKEEDARALAKSTQGAIMAAQNRIDELQAALKEANAAAWDAKADAEVAWSQVAALEEQVTSFKVPVLLLRGSGRQ